MHVVQTSPPLRVLPSQLAQSAAAVEIARVLGALDASCDPEGCKWHGLRPRDRARLLAIAGEMVQNYLLEQRQAEES